MQESSIVLQHLCHKGNRHFMNLDNIIGHGTVHNHLYIGIACTDDVKEGLVHDNAVRTITWWNPEYGVKTQLSLVIHTAIGVCTDLRLVTVDSGNARQNVIVEITCWRIIASMCNRLQRWMATGSIRIEPTSGYINAPFTDKLVFDNVSGLDDLRTVEVGIAWRFPPLRLTSYQCLQNSLYEIMVLKHT